MSYGTINRPVAHSFRHNISWKSLSHTRRISYVDYVTDYARENESSRVNEGVPS
jgi:hypothetical protein